MTTPKFKKKKVSKSAKMKANAAKCAAIAHKGNGERLLKHILGNIDRATMIPETAGRGRGCQRYYRVHLDGSDVAIVLKDRPTVIDRVLTMQTGAYSVHHDLGYRLPIVDKNGEPIVEYVGDPAQLKPLSEAEQWLALCNSPELLKGTEIGTILQCDSYKLFEPTLNNPPL